MDFKLEPSSDMGVLTLDGELTIEHAGELKKILIHAMDSAEHVDIKLKKVSEVDLSCLQVLCSAHRTAFKSNKQLTLSSKDSEIFQQMVRGSGYVRHDSCALNPHKGCLWCGGEE